MFQPRVATLFLLHGGEVLPEKAESQCVLPEGADFGAQREKKSVSGLLSKTIAITIATVWKAYTVVSLGSYNTGWGKSVKQQISQRFNWEIQESDLEEIPLISGGLEDCVCMQGCAHLGETGEGPVKILIPG